MSYPTARGTTGRLLIALVIALPLSVAGVTSTRAIGLEVDPPVAVSSGEGLIAGVEGISVVLGSFTDTGGTVAEAYTTTISTSSGECAFTPQSECCFSFEKPGTTTRKPAPRTGNSSAITISAVQGQVTAVFAEPGDYCGTFTVAEIGGEAVGGFFVAHIQDAALTVTATNPRLQEHTSGAVATLTDDNPAAPVFDYSATIAWDGGAAGPATVIADGGGRHVDASAPSPGAHTYTVVVTDVEGKTAQAGGTLAEADAALTATGSAHSGTPGTLVSGVLGTFTDADVLDTVFELTATTNWGDGTTSTNAVTPAAGSATSRAPMSSGQWQVTGAHIYAQPGVYSAVTTITDSGGATATLVTLFSIGTIAAVSGVQGITTGGTTAATTPGTPGTGAGGDGRGDAGILLIVLGGLGLVVGVRRREVPTTT